MLLIYQLQKQSLSFESVKTAARLEFYSYYSDISFYKDCILKPPRTRFFFYGDYPESDRCLRTSSLIIVQSVHLTCLTSFGDARTVSARICGSADLVSRDLPGLRIRLTTVPSILPERLESTWCHRDLPADQAYHSPLILPVCGSGSLCDARDLSGN